jgi:hypothetical protein
MKKKEQINRLKELVSKMELNHYLLPEAFSDEIEMTFENFSYKTYVGGRGKGRYITFHIFLEDRREIQIMFRNESISTNEDIGKRFSLATILIYIELIYAEKHSFENHSEGIKPLKNKIRKEFDRITSAKKEIKSLREQIKGMQELNIIT